MNRNHRKLSTLHFICRPLTTVPDHEGPYPTMRAGMLFPALAKAKNTAGGVTFVNSIMLNWPRIAISLLVLGLGLDSTYPVAAAPPEAPSVVVVTPGDASVRIIWRPSPGATGYNVKQSAWPDTPVRLVAENIESLEWVDARRNDKSSYYAISAVNESGEGPNSERVMATPSEPILHWLAAGANVERLAGGMQFTEGPVWNPADGGYLIFSDIDGNRLYKWSFSGGLEVFRSPSQNANGNTLDLEGRLLTCEHSTRQVTITLEDGSIQTLVDQYDGKRFNSPNDVVVKSDGTVWFTDPTWGLSGQKELAGQYVFRFDPSTGDTTLVADGFVQPNGLCFSPDESVLYVAESSGPLNIRAFDVQPDGTLTGDRVFANPPGVPDGMRTDKDGRLYSTGEGIFIYEPDARLAARISVAAKPANMCFGGEDEEMMFITARNSLYGITKRPDLIVTGVFVTPKNPSHGDHVKLHAVVKNQGTGPTAADQVIRVAFRLNDEATFAWSDSFRDPLSPGASVLLSADDGTQGSSWRSPVGLHWLEANVDDVEAIAESLEGNNTRTVPVTVDTSRVLSSPSGFMIEGFGLQFIGLPGDAYIVQRSVDLVEWIDWRVVEIGDEPYAIVDSDARQAALRFYRTVPTSP